MEQTPIPVLLSLSGSAQTGDGAEDGPIQIMTTGLMTLSEDSYVLRYQESQPDDDGKTVTTQDVILELSPGRVTMTRLGEYGTSMVFVKDQRFEGVYHTPYGDLDMAVYATRVSCRLAPERGSVHLQYQLDLQGAFAAMHELHLEYVAGEPAES